MNKRSLFVCGSAAKILNSNYYQRKVAPNLEAFDDITIVSDSYIFHDEKENKLALAKNNKKKRTSESIEQWDEYLFDTLRYYNSVLRISHLIKWTRLKVFDTKFNRFLMALDNKDLQIDIIKCPVCKEEHVGPFAISNKCFIKLPCCSSYFNVNKLNKKSTRLKKGYLQLYVASLKKGLVLVSPEFIHNNKVIIAKLGLQNYFYPQTIENTHPQTMLMEEYINNFDSTFIHLEHNKPLTYYTNKLGCKIALLFCLRYKLRAYGCYSISDIIRNKIKTNNVFINDEINSSTVIIKKRIL